MEETRYLISDAAAKVAVEAHVLRYWEEELELAISRTELGHRYYTEEDIRTFQNIKELKERGFQLKAIKVLLPELKKRELKHDQEEMARLEKQMAEPKQKIQQNSHPGNRQNHPPRRTSRQNLRQTQIPSARFFPEKTARNWCSLELIWTSWQASSPSWKPFSARHSRRTIRSWKTGFPIPYCGAWTY